MIMEMTVPTHEFKGEPTLRYQVFVRTTSKRHLEAGADFRLHMSASTLEDAFEMIKDDVDLRLDSVMIRDAEEWS